MAPITIRIRRVFGELAYAQRRSLELRTGLSLTEPPERTRHGRRQVAQLEAVWARGPACREAPVRPNVR